MKATYRFITPHNKDLSYWQCCWIKKWWWYCSIYIVLQKCYAHSLSPLFIICHSWGSNSQPHYNSNHYQLLHSLSYATPRSRSLHSLMAIRLMFASCQILHHAYCTALHLGASCISSPLYDPYLASCSSHVLLMTRTRPIGYDPLI